MAELTTAPFTDRQLKPRQALNKAFLKQKPNREGIEKFKGELIQLLNRLDTEEHEEHVKNNLADFLKHTGFEPNYYINTKGRNDLVIHTGAQAKEPVGVLIEAKKPANKAEMLRPDKLNAKALQELLLYYLRERITEHNLDLKYLVATNIYEWYIFDAQLFERLFAKNRGLVKQFEDFEGGRLSSTNTDFFYREIAQPAIAKVEAELQHTYLDLREFEKPLRNTRTDDDRQLIPLYKILSPEHLLKLPFRNDSNSLDRRFYNELLHLIGLQTEKQKGKELIGRPAKEQRHKGSLLELTIAQLEAHDEIHNLKNASQYGRTHAERLYNVALELCISWVNRILFLKLLEAQLQQYHGRQQAAIYAFLHSKLIGDFDDLDGLFFRVLARRPPDRTEEISERFGHVPYLNSSLFEPTELERATIYVSNLADGVELPLHSQSVLKDDKGKRLGGTMPMLQYLFRFLDAYDFSSEGAEEIQEENKTLINASVLGLIFEKINGYKDGSFFTPGFITMYMCRQSLRRAVLHKFNQHYGWQLSNFSQLYEKIDDKRQANALINSLKICDPAVGSGHFLVSALNELLALKSELKILLDREGRTLRDYTVTVENDELVVMDDDGRPFAYNPNSRESQRVQEALFHQKQTLIENCLFGVDINPNSVKICRLRLWIELLKNAYYKNTSPENSAQNNGNLNSPLSRGAGGVLRGIDNTVMFNSSTKVLETLPNIDINIKQGNSLISRFALDADLGKALKKSKWNVSTYRTAVQAYRHAASKDEKRDMERLIDEIKGNFRTEIGKRDPKLLRQQMLSGKLYNLTQQGQLFAEDKKSKKQRLTEVAKVEKQLNKLNDEIAEIQENKIYEGAFEWRFEFPEVLDDDGNFTGFDVVIGNPPYIRQEEISWMKPYLQQHYQTYAGTADMYVFFVELGLRLLQSGGEFTYILPNKWMRAGYGKALRQWVQQYQMVELADFGDLPVFEEATTYPCIWHISKQPVAQPEFTAATIATLQYESGLANYIQKTGFAVNSQLLTPEGWTLVDSRVQQLLEKIKAAGTPLGEYVEGKIYYGIKTGFNEAFVIDEETKNRLIAEDPKSAEVIKPFLAGRDIKRYQQPMADKYLIFTRRGIDIDSYPAILKHLEQYQESLEPRPKDYAGTNWPGRKPGTYKWYELQDAVDYYQEFEKPKIFIPAIIKRPAFTFDTNGQYGNDKTTIILVEDAEYILGITNSLVSQYLMEFISSTKQNGYYEYKPVYISQITIPPASEEQRAEISRRAEAILQAKAQNPAADTSALEAEIDALVYQLYHLIPEEVALVEG
jgi:hypothetical protein